MRIGRSVPALTAILMGASLLSACGGSSSGIATLNWYINPDNGGQAELAAKCSAASNGAFRIETRAIGFEKP